MRVLNGSVDLNVVTIGDGSTSAPVLFTHGYCASHHMWSENVAELSRERMVVTWDLRGHGETVVTFELDQFTPELAVSDMVAILDELRIERAIIAGMSLGGYLSLTFALAHPDRVAGLVLIDTGPGFKSEDGRSRWNRYAAKNAERFTERGLDALPSTPEVGPGPHSARGLALAAMGILPQRDSSVIERLDEISCPTLIIVGADDEPFLAGSNYMASHIRGARLVLIDGAGHAANLDQPEQFNEALATFLAELHA